MFVDVRVCAMGTEHDPSDPEDRGSALAKLRGILVSSLSRENLSPIDVERDSSPESLGAPRPPARRRRKVRFSESKSVDFLDRGIHLDLPYLYEYIYCMTVRSNRSDLFSFLVKLGVK